MQAPILPPSLAAAAPARPSVRQAAREFETAFLVEMLKAARQANEPLAEQSEMTGAENYQEFAERYLAEELAGKNALGFARLLERELGK
ncbi:MAG: hypothetical protein KDC27_18665 [Acidobacteria bacterium]|nr:hypothetical protein [Acidobacteriota bacterium]